MKEPQPPHKPHSAEMFNVLGFTRSYNALIGKCPPRLIRLSSATEVVVVLRQSIALGRDASVTPCAQNAYLES